MNRKLVFPILLCLALLGVEAQGKPLVAVLPFTAVGVSEADAHGLSVLFETALQNTGAFAVIEQTRSEAILTAQERSLSDCVDELCAVEIGKLLSANQIVMGTVGRVGTVVYLNVKLVDVQTAENLAAHRQQGSTFEYLVGSLDSLAARFGVMEAIGPAIAKDRTLALNESLAQRGLRLRVVPIIAAGLRAEYRGMILTSYALSETEVTQGDYVALMGTNPSQFAGDDHPVDCVFWYDAVRFCNALSLYCGLDPVYSTDTWKAEFTKNGFYLPTDAQWEYAAGGPNHYAWPLGADFNTWDYACSVPPQKLEGTVAVKSHAANGFGLYGMGGNMCEWCHDRSGRGFPYAGETDPTGPDSESYGHRRVRGGAWWTDNPDFLRCEDYMGFPPGGIFGLRIPDGTAARPRVGFRVAIW